MAGEDKVELQQTTKKEITEQTTIDGGGGGDKGHSPFYIATIVMTIVVFVVTLFFNFLSGAPTGKQIGLYVSSTGDVSDAFYIQITPAGWTFSIWGFIYAWQGMWLVYGLVSVFRRCPDGRYLYRYPPVIPITVYYVYMFNLLLNISWIFLFDRKQIIAALVVIAMLPITLIVALVLCYRQLHSSTHALLQHGHVADVWAIRFVVHNALAFYLGWVSCATLLNTAFVLVYRLSVADETASTVALSILLVVVVVYFVLDMSILDKYTRYQFSQYIPVVMALGGSISKNYYSVGPTLTNPVFTVVLLALSLAIFVAKIITMVVRHVKDPFSNGSVTDLQNIKPDSSLPNNDSTMHV